jgi:hypothetical protein
VCVECGGSLTDGHIVAGLRFDALPLAEALRSEGEGFVFAPEKACLAPYVADMRARLAAQQQQQQQQPPSRL